ncbi:glycosyltransferase family 2 protein [Roseiconus nitratireducens]|uniref:glycosyltransferase family 2 protein n=1 Tax=Roseiconus nitratireducens TaxID=2605748 RepID=UPI001375A8E6|nr:glycosyltransferase family 2 protein [Roseiconus nitratireducens]
MSVPLLLPKSAPAEQVTLPSLSSRPLVSVVVPSFNQGRFIGDTLRSILEQDYRPLRIHVIDGGSTDETVDVLKSFGDLDELDWLSERDRGVVEAVNKGFARTEGEIIAIQSSDDMYLPGAISTMVDALRQRPRHGLVYADMETVDANGGFLFRSNIRPFSVRDFLSKQTWVPQPTAFFRRTLLDVCGGWDDRYFSADTELWMRMVFRTQVEKIDKVIAQRRLHDEQRNHQAATIADAYRRMVQDSPDLQRAGADLRRAAKAGTHIHSIRYNASGSAWKASMHLWSALLAAPSLWPNYRDSPLLIPGWMPLRSKLSSVKQALLQARIHEPTLQ